MRWQIERKVKAVARALTLAATHLAPLLGRPYLGCDQGKVTPCYPDERWFSQHGWPADLGAHRVAFFGHALNGAKLPRHIGVRPKHKKGGVISLDLG